MTRFLAAAALAAFENSRFNDFAVLHSLETRLVDAMSQVVPIRRNPIRQTAAAPEKRMEVAQ